MSYLGAWLVAYLVVKLCGGRSWLAGSAMSGPTGASCSAGRPGCAPLGNGSVLWLLLKGPVSLQNAGRGSQAAIPTITSHSRPGPSLGNQGKSHIPVPGITKPHLL